MKKTKFLGIIPARKGSERLPNKNIRKLEGKELILWSIESALKSNVIDTLVVSTDSHEIAEISKNAGAEVPFLRPDELSTNTSSTISVIEHSLEYYEKVKNEVFEFVVLLQPTSPLRTAKHIKEAIDLLKDKNADAIISVTQETHSPLWSNTLNESLSMDHFIPKEILNKRSQDLPQYYRLNGAIYIAKVSKLKALKSFFMENSYAYIMENEFSIDIDTETDFEIAEIFARKYLKPNQ